MKIDLSNIKLFTKEPNINGISYSDDARQRIVEEINTKQPIGTLFPDGQNYDEIDLSKASHQVLNARIDENGDVYAQVQILNTPSGQDLQRVLDLECKVSFSAIGMGTIDENNLVDDYQLVHIPVVDVSQKSVNNLDQES